MRHWLVQLIYLVPLVVLVGVIVAGRRRDRVRIGSAAMTDGRLLLV